MNAWVARREAHCEPMHSEFVSERVLSRLLVNISKLLIHLQDLVNWIRYCGTCSKLGLIGDDFNKYDIFLTIIADLDC